MDNIRDRMRVNLKIVCINLQSPLIYSAFIFFIFFILTKNEMVLYSFNLVYLVYLYYDKSTRQGRAYKYIVLFILLLPSVLKFMALSLLFVIYLAINFDRIYNQIFGPAITTDLIDHILKNLIQLMVFLTIAYLMAYELKGIVRFIPLHPLFFNQVFWNVIKHLDVIYSLLFFLIINVIVFWAIGKICSSIIQILSEMVQYKKIKLTKMFRNYLFSVVILLIYPDITYVMLYSYAYSMIVESVSDFDILLFAFSIHHELPLSEELLKFQENIQNSMILSLIEIMHVLTNKLIDIILITTLLASFFSERIRDFLFKYNENKDYINNKNIGSDAGTK